jgi:hypothetical protein
MPANKYHGPKIRQTGFSTHLNLPTASAPNKVEDFSQAAR